MNEEKKMISNEEIEAFLHGSDPQKYIVAIDAEWGEPKVTLVINDPQSGKRLETHTFKPFLWFKRDITTMLYEGKRMKIMEACGKYDIKITKLRTSNHEGFSPQRLEDGYKFMAVCKKSYNHLISFFKEGGIDVFDKDLSKQFVMFSPIEQFMIQSGKRLFKGMDDYNDIHRFQFDLETEGLFASKHAIFQIGVRDNRGLEGVLEVEGKDGYEKRNAERDTIKKFFEIIDIVKPDVITGYNSENFDWPYLFDRADRLSIPITELAITLNRISKIKRRPSTVKLGGETEHYNQTHMFGYNIIDISHAVRRAMAINSEIKAWGLKYITKYSEIAKPNRVYVPGDKINSTWSDKINQYAFNDKNGDWYKISETNKLKADYKIVTGAYVVQRYLCDDLWETEQIDNIFNQASFLLAKILPTHFERSSTMGTAGQWNLIMAAWSYQNELAIPATQTKKDFTGGLSRLLEVGYARNVVKLDYAALYPKTQLTHDIFPDLDISGVMKGMLTYVVDTRDKFKFLTSKEKKLAKNLEAKLKEDSNSLTPQEIESIKAKISEHKALSNLYDKKQLPLKILANSWFGSYGAPYIFNWGDTDSAEETTCRGRQYLRLMVKHFTEKHGFRALVGDTDGFNFSFPKDIDSIKYTAEGKHWKTIEDGGKELTGLDAVLAEFNETYMKGRMGLDIDDIYTSTINFSRKNYANLDDGGKIKLVGNSIKSKKMSVYIEDFLAKAIRMLLDGDGYSFIQLYYEYVDKIYNYQIPLVKIASKAKVKISMREYKDKAKLKNKAGNPLPKQAHMELAMKDNIETNLGDVIYYINTGTAKSHGDLKSERNKETGVTKLTLNCKMIKPEIIERDFELIKELEMLKKALITVDTNNKKEIEGRIEAIDKELFTDEYNVARYLDAFNKKVKPLLVCFHSDIREKILLDIVKIKDKTTKKSIEKLKDRIIFTKAECELVHGIPNKPTDQDSYEELMRMEDKEIKFWDRVNKVPNEMDKLMWESIRTDYIERMRIAKEDGLIFEKSKIEDIIKRLELNEINNLLNDGSIPKIILDLCCKSDEHSNSLISKKWNEPICDIIDLFKFESEAIERDKFYKLMGCENDDTKYEKWLDYVREQKNLTGDTFNVSLSLLKDKDIEKVVEKIKDNIVLIEVKQEENNKKKKLSESEGDDEEVEETENNEGEIIRSTEVLQLDDEFDDTNVVQSEEVKLLEINIKKEPKLEEKDEWGF